MAEPDHTSVCTDGLAYMAEPDHTSVCTGGLAYIAEPDHTSVCTDGLAYIAEPDHTSVCTGGLACIVCVAGDIVVSIRQHLNISSSSAWNSQLNTATVLHFQ